MYLVQRLEIIVIFIERCCLLTACSMQFLYMHYIHFKPRPSLQMQQRQCMLLVGWAAKMFDFVSLSLHTVVSCHCVTRHNAPIKEYLDIRSKNLGCSREWNIQTKHIIKIHKNNLQRRLTSASLQERALDILT